MPTDLPTEKPIDQVSAGLRTAGTGAGHGEAPTPGGGDGVPRVRLELTGGVAQYSPPIESDLVAVDDAV
ncbi:hypothetical protein, partial [Streptomyces sp. NPDC046631]|uniref:hypothetical protein n=1 Tax=Streptomyces sp. NPDC046631 TaxID=3160978 RepID=UPI0033E95DB1